MILAIRIMKHDLNHASDIIECLAHNASVLEISKIMVFCDGSIPGIGQDGKSKKILWMKSGLSHIEAIRVSSKASSCCVIYSTPFVKFDSGIGILAQKAKNGSMFRMADSWYLFRKDSVLRNGSSIDGILGGPFEIPPFDFRRSGYFNNPSIRPESFGWKICEREEHSEEADIVEADVFSAEEGPIQVEAKVDAIPRVDVIIVSVNYGDFLRITLPENMKRHENITVVTSPNDRECVSICQNLGVKVVVTDSMYSDGAKFNKGKAINEGIKSIDSPELILLIDADTIDFEGFDASEIKKDTIYYKDRILMHDFSEYSRYLSGERSFSIESSGAIGYYQLFRYKKSMKYPEFSPDAAWSDVRFSKRFKYSVRMEGLVGHLGKTGKNWNGRITERFGSIESPTSDKYTICSYYFNYRNDERQKKNFQRFLAQFEGRYDNLIVGLIDYGDLDFDIPCRKMVLEGDPNRRIWSKELLINKISQESNSEYIIWIDGDIIYDSLDWLDDIDSVADGFDFVQLFDKIDYLGEKGDVLETHRSIASSKSKDVDSLLAKGFKPGGAWLAKNSIIKSKSLFDRMAVGGGDTILAYALYGKSTGNTLEGVKRFRKDIWRDATSWIGSFGAHKVGLMNSRVSHLYHSDLKDRNYDSRYSKLLEMRTRGIMIIAFGFDYEKAALYCVETIRKFSDIDILVCTNIPDFARSSGWNSYANMEFRFFDMNDGDNRIIKTQLSRYTIFDQTLYIDSDSSVASDRFMYPFEMLDEYDIISPEWKTFTKSQIEKLSENSGKFKKFLKIAEKFDIEKDTYIAGGVCYFNRGNSADSFFRDFNDLWVETGKKEDMPGLNGAMFRNREIVGKLDNSEFNNYNSEIIVSHHNSLIQYDHLEGFTRRRYNPSSDEWEFCDQGTVEFYKKKKVAFIYDVEGWAFYIMSHSIKRFLAKKFEVDIFRFDEDFDQESYDAIVCFSPSVLPKNATKNIICGISSHKSGLVDKSRIFDFAFSNNIEIFENMVNANKFYIENGVNTEFFKLDSKKKSKKFRIGAIGSKKWQNHKGKHRIDKICEMLGDEFENRSIFIDTKDRSKIMSQSDMREYYSTIDVFLVSSESETGPNTLLEAMSCGVPVISNRVGLAPIAIESMHSGILIDRFDDIESYVDAIMLLKNNKRLYKKISKNAMKSVENWNWKERYRGFDSMISEYIDRSNEDIL